MWVVKLGGSLIGTPALKGWLDAFAQFGDGKIVIVPGGGVFADAVRDAQAKTGIDDATAHHMAVLAMDQYATLITSLNADLVMASSEIDIAGCGWQHRAVVWKPSLMVLADKELPMSWDLSSDSLAAWLATKLNAQHLLVVKSISHRHTEKIEVKDLMLEGVVDSYFGAYSTGKSFKTWLVSKNEFMNINQVITHQSRPMIGVEIVAGTQS
jgi:5-(aminomethyl)-3-furanmethanol phosphate kinase